MFTSAVRPYSSDTHYRKATGDALVDCATTDRLVLLCAPGGGVILSSRGVVRRSVFVRVRVRTGSRFFY